MGGRVVAAEGDAKPEQTHEQPAEIRAQDQQTEKKKEDEHLDDEHTAAPKHVGKTAEPNRADKNAEQRCSADQPVLEFADPNSLAIKGRATPVMKTTSPSKNLPAAASHQMRRCMDVIGTISTGVPSRHAGVSSI